VIAMSMAIIYFLSFMSNLGLFRHCATGRCWPLTVRIANCLSRAAKNVDFFKLSMRKYNICTYLIQLPLTPNNDKNDVEAYIYWVLGEIIVVHHQKFQDLNNNKSYFCKFDGIRRNFN
jgi:hypothetical protein